MERRVPAGSRAAAPFRAKARAASRSADPEVTCRAGGMWGAAASRQRSPKALAPRH